MRNLLDWKFLITLLAAVAGTVVVVWIWRAELTTRSLHFRLAAQTALQPEEKTTVKGLKISIDGVELESPYLSVFELINDGAKPIATADFESPIELRVAPDASVARARVTATRPKDLEAELVTEKQSVKLKPLLLNPEDTVTIAIITSGKPPQFSSRARIAGVIGVPLVDATKSSKLGGKKWLVLAAGFLLAVCYWIASDGFLKRAVYLRPRAAVLVSILSGLTGTVLIVVFLDAFGLQEFWRIALSVIGLGIAAAIAAAFWNRREIEEKTRESKDAP
ncbi:MAG: hypothetical protein HY016_01835 [Nitrosomonadales bacterium]|nr:hypothetical protein [Nitrosomonadales bacterium]